ncbi:MAG: LysE family transporter [Nitrospirae bacterium]|nr:LysE family transporter [Nitrospirota bacterium]
MNLIVIAVSSFLIALSGALVPGPLFTITVTESARRGASTGPLLILGHAILEILIIILILSGLSPFLKHETTRYVISLAGGGMLLLMGIMILKDLRRVRLDLSAESGNKKMNLVLTGIVGSLVNPYWVIWWATIGLGYLVSAMKYGFAGIAVFFLGHISADLAWYSLVSYAVAKGRKIMGDKAYRIVLAVCAVFLIFFGAWFIKAA